MPTKGSEPRRLRVLLMYRVMIPSIRLCGHCQMEYLAQQGKLDYRAKEVMKLTDADLSWADIVIIGRLDGYYERKLAEHLKKAGKYLLYILDDDLLNVPPELASGAYYNRPDRQKNILKMIGLSDAIISPSPLLLKKYAVNGRRAIQNEEPAIDPVAYRPHDPAKPVKIGFAGSIDRTHDLESILKDALLRIRAEFGETVEFAFFGAIPSFAKELDAKCIPYCDSYDQYRQTLNALEWDIGLAPMPDTPFHNCKHYNKFCEYAAASVVGIFTDVQPYTRAKTMSDAGVFCENTAQAWYQSIKGLLTDPAERERRRKRMSVYAHTVFSVEASAMAFYEEFRRIPAALSGKPLRLVTLRIKPGYFADRVFCAWKTYKFGILKKLFERLFR